MSQIPLLDIPRLAQSIYYSVPPNILKWAPAFESLIRDSLGPVQIFERDDRVDDIFRGTPTHYRLFRHPSSSVRLRSRKYNPAARQDERNPQGNRTEPKILVRADGFRRGTGVCGRPFFGRT